MRLERVDHQPGAAVARIHHDLQRLQRRGINVAEQVLYIRRTQIQRAHAGQALRRHCGRCRGVGFQLPQSGIAGDGDGTAANQLHAVVVHRVVAGGHHDAAVDAGLECREIDFLGAAQAEVHYLSAVRDQAMGQRMQQVLARQPHVPPQRDALGGEAPGISRSQAIGDIRVQFVGHAAANVISFEAG